MMPTPPKQRPPPPAGPTKRPGATDKAGANLRRAAMAAALRKGKGPKAAPPGTEPDADDGGGY